MVADWSNFLIAETGAAAELAGLIFVAVSINLSEIIEYQGVAGRAAEALALLIGVLLIGTFGLAPNQSGRILGSEFVAVGGLRHDGRVSRRPVFSQATVVGAGLSSSVVSRRNAFVLHRGRLADPTTSAWVLLIEILLAGVLRSYMDSSREAPHRISTNDTLGFGWRPFAHARIAITRSASIKGRGSSVVEQPIRKRVLALQDC